jgi:hypothetical protein
MAYSNIIRWSGIAAMVGGVPWVLWSNLFQVSVEAAGGPRRRQRAQCAVRDGA